MIDSIENTPLRPDIYLSRSGYTAIRYIRPAQGTLKIFFEGPRWGKRARKSDRVFYSLIENIIMGRLTPGTVLGEQHIALEHDCAQGTVREALIRLEQKGLVVRNDYRGTHVSEILGSEIQQMVNIRRQLETFAARHTAGNLNENQIQALEIVVEAIYCAAAQKKTFLCSEYDRFFHNSLFSFSGFIGLSPVLNRCTLHFHRYSLSRKTDLICPDTARERHLSLLSAFTSGSSEQAAEAIASHIQDLTAQWPKAAELA